MYCADSKDPESQLIRSVYHASGNIENVLTYSGPYNGKAYPGLDPVADAALVKSISKQFDELLPQRLQVL